MQRPCDTGVVEEVVLSTDAGGEPSVVRVGSTVRRPVGAGSALVARMLEHLGQVGFDRCPRFLGHDEQGRQVLSFVEGDVWPAPPWQHDDIANAKHLGLVARLLRDLHEATSDFIAPAAMEPARPLPLPGLTWTHGDVGYQNLVYREGLPFALIDWEFVAPADLVCDLAGLLALSVRAPRPDVEDNHRRTEAVALALEAIVDGYRLDAESARRLPEAAAVVLDDAASYWTEQGGDVNQILSARWRAAWFRTQFQP